MIKASEVREQQHKARIFRLEERYSKQIKEQVIISWDEALTVQPLDRFLLA